MSPTFARLALAAAAISIAATAVSAEPFKLVREAAKDEAPVRVEAAMFELDASLADAGSLGGLLRQSGVSETETASAIALAATEVEDREAVRVKLGLSRDPDSGTLSLQRMTLSTAGQQTVFEQREGDLRVVSSAPRKLRTI